MIDKVLLFPYYAVLKLRNSFYSSSRRKPALTEVPSVCVGNVTVGGTGKTPHVEMILRMLRESERWGDAQLAVLSRGYKRDSKGFQQVTVDGSAEMLGDEPLQIKKKFPGVTVAVCKNRVEGSGLLCHPDRLEAKKYARKCWNPEFPPADFLVLDDAYQYRKLKPELNIVLVDYNRPVFKDMLLPLGRLRDLPERVADADVVIVSKCPAQLENQERKAFADGLKVLSYNQDECECISASGKRQLLLFTTIDYTRAQGVYECTEPRYVYSKKAIMVTGIAKDTPLRKHLSDSYKIVSRFSFPDHHKFSWSDISKIQAALRKNPTASIFTTEKDTQRLLDFNGMPKEIMERCFMIPIETRFLSEAERSAFARLLEQL